MPMISESEFEAAHCVAKRHAYRSNDFDFETAPALAWISITYRPNNLQAVYQTTQGTSWLAAFERDLSAGAYGSFPARKAVRAEDAVNFLDGMLKDYPFPPDTLPADRRDSSNAALNERPRLGAVNASAARLGPGAASACGGYCHTCPLDSSIGALDLSGRAFQAEGNFRCERSS
jgi:hypothetical protein